MTLIEHVRAKIVENHNFATERLKHALEVGNEEYLDWDAGIVQGYRSALEIIDQALKERNPPVPPEER